MIFWITGLLAVVAMYFIFRYLKTGKTTEVNTDAPLFGLVVFIYSVILQYCLKSDSGASSIMANGITLTFIIVAFLDNVKDAGGFSGRILDKVDPKSRPCEVLLMFLSAAAVVVFATVVSWVIQCLLLS